MNADSRKTLAVMFTDIAGFTGHMEQNEAAALEMVSLIRKYLIPLLKSSRGTLVKEMGDGTLSIFEDSRAAVRCSRKLQEKLAGCSFKLRIGIHLGTVHLRPGDVLGDTVNVASRLEKMAPAGGICISGELLKNMGGGRRPAVHSLGLQPLKGLGRLIDLYTVKGTAKHRLPCSREARGRTESLIRMAVGEVPSVAVMPLQNLGAAGDEFYAHGISADIVSQLAAAGGIAVAPLNDVIKLRKAVSSGAGIASRLNARFFVTGSLLRKDRRFQLSMELHDLQMQKMVWTDSWVDDWFELPSIKEKVADSILKVFGIQKAAPGPEEGGSISYELYLQASEIYWRRKSFSDIEKARALLEKALSIDPDMTAARILLGVSFTESGDFSAAGREFTRAYETVQYTGDRNGHLQTLIWMGINQWRQSDFRTAKHTFQRAMMLARGMGELQAEARALSNMGLMECNLGEYDNALDHFQRALKVPGLSAMGNLKANTLCNIGITHWSMGDNESAYQYYLKAMELYRKLESTDGQATMMMNLGVVTRNMGRYQESLDYTGKALELHTAMGDLQGQCRSMIGMGNTRRFIGMNAEAMEDYEKAREIADRIGDRMTSSIALTNMADIFSDGSDFEKAENLYREALNISREIGDREGEGENLGYLGLVLRKLGKTAEAVEALRESIGLLEEIGAPARAVGTRLNLAETLLESGSGDDSAQEVMEHIRKVEELVHPGMNDLTQSNLTLSDLYLKLADIPSAGDSMKLSRKSRAYMKAAYASLMKTAATIENEEQRASFLNTRTHRRIIDECSAGKLIDS